MKDGSATQHHDFDKEEQGLSFSHIAESSTQSSQIPIPPDLEISIQENLFESMLNLPDDFDWELFDTQIRPQVSVSQDTWPDLDI